ncbi:cation diffusion facilitator family transporter [Symbiopectobacterium sp. RP]|uniref:cation diffusion facilitator family transporter n=1 Tax=Symbiopectobacterium sp. RP TaxID=3248553 RepID=UPI003D2A6107
MSHSHHDHAHDHAPTVARSNERKVLIAFVITFTFMLVEVVGGVLSGSLALLADAGHMLTDAGHMLTDAGHMLTDAAALTLSYAAFRFGRRNADTKRTFGYLRFEVIAGFINALTLFAIVIWIACEAWLRFRQPHEVLAGPMLLVAAIGLLVNIVVFLILTRGDSEHINIKGAALHVMGDLLGSIGAIAAAIVVYFTGWTPIDPILSLVVSVLILRSAWALLKKSLHILLEGAPANAMPQEIERYLKESVTGVAVSTMCTCG